MARKEDFLEMHLVPLGLCGPGANRVDEVARARKVHDAYYLEGDAMVVEASCKYNKMHPQFPFGRALVSDN